VRRILRAVSVDRRCIDPLARGFVDSPRVPAAVARVWPHL